MDEPRSCKQVLVHGGQMMAIPHFPRHRRVQQPQVDLFSVQQGDFVAQPPVSCASNTKPLEPYNVNAGRNRLVLPTPPPPPPNRSAIKFESGDDRRRFVTSNRNDYRGIHGQQSTNAGIVAQRTRFFHRLQQL